MFSGIVTHLGRLGKTETREGGELAMEIESSLPRPRIGASVACSGVCLTVEAAADGVFAVSASRQTLSHTNLGGKSVGSFLNLETSLRLGDELGGHLVFGHVDGVVEVLAIKPQGRAKLIRVSPPPENGHLLCGGGSVALEGISLTVAEVESAGAFSFTGVPHTLESTSLGKMGVGTLLNLEFDMLARYVANSLAKRK